MSEMLFWAILTEQHSCRVAKSGVFCRYRQLPDRRVPLSGRHHQLYRAGNSAKGVFIVPAYTGERIFCCSNSAVYDYACLVNPLLASGRENQIDNIINGDFAYASGSRSTGKAPEGMWRFCWSHLPRYLKDDFYETFRKGGGHSTEATRYSTEDWLQKFEYYLDLLKSGKLASQDSMSLDIFPSRLKKNPKATYIRCKLCGNEVDEERTEQGICQSCLKKVKSIIAQNVDAR